MPFTPKYIPAIGSSGYYDLQSPFDVKINIGERYTLKSVRTLSECLASNEDTKNDIYVLNGIEADYNDDLINDVEILGLQSERGAWVYVPVTYVKGYPVANGIPYRANSIVIPLQPVPADSDLSGLLSQLNEVVLKSLGFEPEAVVVEASRVTLISTSAHEAVSNDRAVLKDTSSAYATIQTLNAQLALALAKVQALETYIINNP